VGSAIAWDALSMEYSKASMIRVGASTLAKVKSIDQ
jgi:hypothetical protein